ncbi:hypothetical protein PsYK624_043520 [Phanerochaete sordida]|uniref:Uncharacterized protein n=1 Tax=Phanerochaete sordida TaxID=48140 RepID=A0A9P3LB73_9APHY|nr:hypothetical protein PsYK624_043520 [Phanerochaete sordida]
MQALTNNPRYGIEFVEGFQLSRIAVAVLLPVLASLLVALIYTGVTKDVSSGFTIAGYMTGAYSVCLVLIGVLNLAEH